LTTPLLSDYRPPSIIGATQKRHRLIFGVCCDLSAIWSFLILSHVVPFYRIPACLVRGDAGSTGDQQTWNYYPFLFGIFFFIFAGAAIGFWCCVLEKTKKEIRVLNDHPSHRNDLIKFEKAVIGCASEHTPE
jgi:hypothetical protein